MKINRKASFRIGIVLGVLAAAVALYYLSFASIRWVNGNDNTSNSSLVICGITIPWNSTTGAIYSTIYYPIRVHQAAKLPVQHYRGVARQLSVKDLSYIRLYLEDRADTVDIFVTPQFRSAVKPLLNGPSVAIICDGEPIPDGYGLRYKIAALAVDSE
jgi:hypothetical protein